MDDRKRRVERRAYELWETEGRAHGRDLDHWLRAERAERETEGAQKPKPQPAEPAAKPARSRKTAPRKRSRKAEAGGGEPT